MLIFHQKTLKLISLVDNTHTQHGIQTPIFIIRHRYNTFHATQISLEESLTNTNVKNDVLLN